MNKGQKKQKGDDLSSGSTEDYDIFKTIFELANDIIVYVDTLGRIVDVNGKVERVLGYKPEELKGASFAKLNLLSLKDAPKVLKLFGDAVIKGNVEISQTEARNIMVLELRHKNGNMVLFEASTTAIQEGGKLKGFISIIRDITEQRQAREKQREIGKRFRNLFDNCPLGVYRTTPDGRILDGNPALVQMLGFSSFEELAARNLEEKGFEPDYPRSEFKQIMESRNEVKGLEAAWIRQDGTTIFVRENAKAVRDEKGNILYYEGTVEDITERKRTEEELKKSREKLNIALEKTGISVWNWNVKTGEISFDDHWARMLGYEPGKIKFDFDWWKRSVHPDSLPVFEKELNAYLEGRKEHYELEYRMQTKSGEWIWIWARGICSERDEKGKPERFMGTHRDITKRKQAEEALSLSEERLRRAQAIANIGDWDWDITSNTLLWSIELYRIFGVKREDSEFSFENIESLIHPEDRESNRRQVKELLDHSDSGEFSFRIIRPDGKVRHINQIFEVVRDNSGKATRAFGTMQDVTEQEWAEEKHRTIIKTALDGFWITTPEGKLLEVNDSYCRMIGYTREELLGMSIRDIEAVEKPQEVSQHLRKVFEQGFDRFETRQKRKDGKLIDVEVSVNYLDVEGGQIFVFLRDITERKQVEETLRESEEKYRLLFENANDAIYLHEVSREGPRNIFAANEAACRMLGYTQEELLRMTIADIDVPEQMEKIPAILDRLFSEGYADFETEHVRKDGSRIQVLVSLRTFDLRGTMVMLSIVKDITERKQAEEALRRERDRAQKYLDIAGVMIMAIDSNQRITLINRKGCEVLGFEEKDILGKNWFDIFLPEKRREGVRDIFRTLMAGNVGQLEYVEDLIVTGSGEERMITWHNTILKDEKGDIVGTLSSGEDITERKLAEEEKSKLLLDLGERVKELNCLFEMERLLYSPTASLEDIYQKTANLMPPAWKYPEIACARITVDEKRFESADFEETQWKQESRIIVNGNKVGTVEFCYREERPDIYEGPFLKEERTLISLIAERLGETIEYRRAEVALQEERNKLKAIVESMEYGLTIHDRDYRIIYQNEALIKQVGEHLGEKCYWAYEHRGQICDGCPVQLAWEDGDSHTSERKAIMPSGEITFWENTASPIRDAKGKIVACLEITRNITERKKTDEALKKSEANLREAQRIAHMGSWSLDLATNKIALSEEMMDIYKLPKSERSGELAFEIWEKYVHPEDKRKVQNAFENALSDERPYDIEFRIFRSDNKIRILHALGDIVKDETGRPVRMIGTGLDVTERRLAEEELRESEQKYRDLVENINDVIYSVDQRGIITYISPVVESITGYKTVETIGRSFSEFVYPEDMPEVIMSFEETKSGKLFPAEYRIFRKDGQEIWIRAFSRPVFKEGKYRGLRGVMTDVTERKRLLQQLIQSEKAAAVGTLAYGIAHEFNNILAGIMANAEFGASIENMQQIRKCFKVIVENSQRGSSITNSLLTVAGERKGKKQIANITQPLRNILSFSRRELEKANIKIVEDLKPVPEILCDPGQFSEVFLNMINNARDAMLPKGGALMIRLDYYLGNIRIIFKDTGCGISDELIDKIYDPFITTKGALGGSDIPGTGLGLYLTRGIVESYGGKIEVMSHVGKGTTFTILIPVSKNLPSEPELEKETTTPQEIQNKLNILLIDDEEVICRVLSKYLESKGHTVTASMEALEGLEHFQKDKYDVVLSDITMPEMDGIELIKEMKQKNPDVKIIAITGHVHRDKLEQAKKAGAEEVLIKPFKSADLYSSIIKLFQNEAKEKNK